MSAGGRQYRLLRELGTGTFGTVYQAEMLSVGGFKKQVALKVLHPMWEKHPDAARRFRDEARLLGQLRHRHVVQVDGLVRVGGRWAVVMEYVEGVDANILVKACRKAKVPFPIPACLEVAAAIGSALDAAYNHAPEGEGPLRVIHRDIKPSNVRLTADADVKVLDFGIAQADFSGREAMTQSVRYGSIRYMSPERRNAEDDSPAGDVYAVGCVLFELITGRPFGNALLVADDHQAKIATSMAKLLKHGGPDAPLLVELLESMLAFDEKKRPVALEAADRARGLSRIFPGEDLHSFARRMIPEVPKYVDDGSQAVQRTVGDSGGTVADSVLLDDDASMPHLFTEEVGRADKRSGKAPAEPATVLPPWLTLETVTAAALTGAVVCVLLILVLQALPRSPEGPAPEATARLAAIVSATTTR